MFYQHKIQPNQLTEVIQKSNECFFTINAKLMQRTYDVAVYKYNSDYFLINDTRIFKQMDRLRGEVHGDENKLLHFIEQAMEDKLYCKIKEEYIQLDLAVLDQMKTVDHMQVTYYEFIEM